MEVRDPIFTSARGMRIGDIIIYDPSEYGTGERKEGRIKEISRSLLSLVLEDGTCIGACRVYTYRHPGGAEEAPLSLVPKRRKRRWPSPNRGIYIPFPS